MKHRIFLGGTCNGSTWRENLTRVLDVDCFNPVVEDWTPQAQQNEEYEKGERCNIHLYVITHEMKGVFSIAEVIDSVHTPCKTTVLQVMPDGFGDSQLKSLKAVVDLVCLRGGIAYIDSELNRTARILNNSFRQEV